MDNQIDLRMPVGHRDWPTAKDGDARHGVVG